MKLMKIRNPLVHPQPTRKNNSKIKIHKTNQNRIKEEKFLIYHMQNNNLNNKNNSKQNTKKTKKCKIRKKSNNKMKKKSRKKIKKMPQRQKSFAVLKITIKESKKLIIIINRQKIIKKMNKYNNN